MPLVETDIIADITTMLSEGIRQIFKDTERELRATCIPLRWTEDGHPEINLIPSMITKTLYKHAKPVFYHMFLHLEPIGDLSDEQMQVVATIWEKLFPPSMKAAPTFSEFQAWFIRERNLSHEIYFQVYGATLFKQDVNQLLNKI